MWNCPVLLHRVLVLWERNTEIPVEENDTVSETGFKITRGEGRRNGTPGASTTAAETGDGQRGHSLYSSFYFVHKKTFLSLGQKWDKYQKQAAMYLQNS